MTPVIHPEAPAARNNAASATSSGVPSRRTGCCSTSASRWIVDRLERFGLAERRPVPGDRRVRQVVLTPAGERLRAELLEEFHTPPTDLLRLGRKDLEALARLLDQL